MSLMSRTPRDAGSASLELVIWAPVLLLVAAVIVLAGRIAQATQAVEVAATEAARAASAAELSPRVPAVRPSTRLPLRQG